MIIKNQMVEIGEDSIFANDVLERESVIRDLSSLITSYHQPFVFSVNASWGAGKTTFLKLWQAYLKKEHHVNSIYFSAWEDDFSKEPLLSILGEINNHIANNTQTGEIKDKFEKVKTLGGKIIRRGLPAFVKGATAGVLDTDAGYEAALGAMSEQTIKALIDNYSDDKKILDQFKSALETLIETIDTENPFIIFIDELDRCRPLYAIELLERLKHVFGIKNLIFVLAIDKKQLSESIKSQYGQIDTDRYLKRFIDLEYNLKNPGAERFCEVLYRKYEFDRILREKGIETHQSEYHHLNVMKKLVVILQLSLRDIEHVFTRLHIVFKTMPPLLNEAHFRVFVLFEMLRAYDSELYEGLIFRQGNKEVIKNLVLSGFQGDSRYRDVSLLIEAAIDTVGKSDDEYSLFIMEYKAKLEAMTNNQTNEYQRLGYLIETLEHTMDWGDYRLNNLVETVVKKLEFADEFDLGVAE